MKKILSFALIIIIVFSNLTFLSSCDNRTPLEKLIYLHETALDSTQSNNKLQNLASGIDRDTWEEKHKEDIKTVAEEIGMITPTDSSSENHITKSDISAFLNTYSMTDLITLISKLSRYTGYSSETNKNVLGWAIETHPEKFITIDSLTENAEGYYSTNKTSQPIPREEPSDRSDHLTDKFTVKYYGDYAIQYADTNRYNPGKYGWKNGVFEDVLPYHESEYYNTLYYKGMNAGIFYNSYWDKDLVKNDLHIFISEENNASYFIYIDEDGLWTYQYTHLS